MGGVHESAQRARSGADRSRGVHPDVRAGAAGWPARGSPAAKADPDALAALERDSRWGAGDREFLGHHGRVAILGARDGGRHGHLDRDARRPSIASNARSERAAGERDDTTLDRRTGRTGGGSSAGRPDLPVLRGARVHGRGCDVPGGGRLCRRDAPHACGRCRAEHWLGSRLGERARGNPLRARHADPAGGDPARSAGGPVRRCGGAAAAVRALDSARWPDGSGSVAQRTCGRRAVCGGRTRRADRSGHERAARC